MKIAQVIRSDSWGEISPAAFERGIGGREGAMVRLAKEWATLGHEVTNFVTTSKSTRFPEWMGKGDSRFLSGLHPVEGFHEYIPLSLAQPMLASFPYDAVVAWECPSIFDSDEVMEKQRVRLVHMQVAHLQEKEEAEKCSTGVVALSEWAKDFMIHDGVKSDNFYVRPNGVEMNSYPLEAAMKKANTKRPSFVYSSSPDRGLWQLLSMWPEIRKQYKKANLFVGYGVNKYVQQIRWAHSRIGQMSVDIERLMQQPGVVDVGKIGQKQLAQLQLKATAWLYPCDSIQATETGCITAIENMAAGNPCIMSDADCLESEFESASYIVPLPFKKEEWMDKISLLLQSDLHYNRMRKLGRMFAEKRDWSKIAPTWIDLFEENRDAQ